MLYEAVNDNKYGLLDIKAIRAIIQIEQQILAWDKPSGNFKNTKFNGASLAWQRICFAGENAPADPRTGSARCHPTLSYNSPLLLFISNHRATIPPAVLAKMSLAEE